MAYATNSQRGLKKWFSRIGVSAPRFVAWPKTTTPADPPIHIRPTAAPTVTAAKGDGYFDSTVNDIAWHDGTAFVFRPKYERVEDFQNQVAAASYAVNHTIFVNDNLSGTYKVVAVSAVFGTASTSGTLQVEVATGTQAITAGTNQLTGTVSLSGTANTVVNGTIIGSPTTVSAGARINLIFAGTVTNLANCAIVVVLQRLT